MKLLLIEDDEHVAQVLAEAFASDGHETTIRYTVKTGSPISRRAPGTRRARRAPADSSRPSRCYVRSDRRTSMLPVIIMTGLATPGRWPRCDASA